jgi:hypothetical protein
MTKLTTAFSNLANAPKKGRLQINDNCSSHADVFIFVISLMIAIYYSKHVADNV